ncbi:hypothetical protein [Dehalogenimonas alkenigignens]|uniref:hypothetical protein n=1 Tax=Dehalogenimonas alkenigignens TaxID=1217799 RepID=UPI000D5886D8|nr:hypothetical protein [Dehalogenimonas alkenigignens]PVV82497.1 hypothetical protein DD509_08635 [Dehalogenimonas alkenigignens]
MNKIVLRLISGTIILAVLAGGSVALAAADKTDRPQPKTEQAAGEKSQGAAGDRLQNTADLAARVMQMQNRNLVAALLDRLVAAGKITQGDANKILKDWDDQHPNWQPPIDQLKARIMDMGNRNNVVALLDRLLAGAKITQGEYHQILNGWDNAHPNWQPIDPIQRIMEMKNRNLVTALLDRMVTAGKITQGDANKILKDWDDAHPGWVLDSAALHDRVMKMQNRDNVVALLDRLVEGGRLNQGDANKILKDWEGLHAAAPARTPKT